MTVPGEAQQRADDLTHYMEACSRLKQENAALVERVEAAERDEEEAWAAVHSEEAAYVRQRELRVATEARVAELEEALREIAEDSPNWMEPDALHELVKRIQAVARAAVAGVPVAEPLLSEDTGE